MSEEAGDTILMLVFMAMTGVMGFVAGCETAQGHANRTCEVEAVSHGAGTYATEKTGPVFRWNDAPTPPRNTENQE